MNTSRKNLWAMFFLTFFISSSFLGNVRANQEPTEPIEGRSSFKIVGGSPVVPGAYPWTVQIGFEHPSFGAFGVWCGGALIDRSWVLSAAHCFDDTTVSRYTLTVGEHDLNQNEGTEQIVNLAEIIIHPDYQASTSSDNDIALLRLASPVQLNAQVGIVEIGSLPQTATPLTVVGWGRTTQGGSVSDILMQTHVPLRTDSDCRQAYPGRITDSMFCAGFDVGQTDSCQGDSGGPIFFDEGGGEWRQVGVVSWGIGCAQPNKFGVYTNVARFTTWITDAIGDTGGGTGDGDGVREAKQLPISPPLTKGSISPAGTVNLFSFTVETQGSYTIETKGEHNHIDTVMSLFGPNSQTTLVQENDDLASGNLNSRITADLTPGVYFVKVKLYHDNQVGNYTIFNQANE